MTMIREITENKRQYLRLLLLSDEQESMIQSVPDTPWATARTPFPS